MRFLTIFCTFILGSCNPFNYYPDSQLEEIIEKSIEEKTGVYIDLSGDTPDPDKH